MQQTNIKLPDVMPATAQFAKSVAEGAQQTVKLVLNPATLGTITVNLTLSQNVADVNFRADSREVAKFIESQIPALREKLNQQGIQAGNIDSGLRNQERDTNPQGGSQQNFAGSKEERRTQRDFIGSFRNLRETPGQEPMTDLIEKIKSLEQRAEMLDLA